MIRPSLNGDSDTTAAGTVIVFGRQIRGQSLALQELYWQNILKNQKVDMFLPMTFPCRGSGALGHVEVIQLQEASARASALMG